MALTRRLHEDLHGILHTAGVADKGLLSSVVAGDIGWMCAPKAFGAWHLNTATQGSPLEVQVMFSSVGSGLGNVGQGNYAAGNASLDAHALSRRACGAAVCSLQWPLVGGAGMGAATFAALEEAKASMVGMAGITLEQYAACLEWPLGLTWGTGLGV